MLCQFQVYSKVIQLYIYMNLFFFKFFSHLGYYRVLIRAPCERQSKLAIAVCIFKTDNQPGPTVQHEELCSVLCNNLNGKRIWKRMDACACMTESLCCTPGTNAASFIRRVSVIASGVSDSLQPHGLWPARLLCPWDSPGKNTGVCCHFLLQGIFPIQGSNLGLLYCNRILYCLSHQGSSSKVSTKIKWIIAEIF